MAHERRRQAIDAHRHLQVTAFPGHVKLLGHPIQRPPVGPTKTTDPCSQHPKQRRPAPASAQPSCHQDQGCGQRHRAPGQQRRHASFLGWSLDCAANILRAADGSEHLLGTAETQVLRAFVERPHQILTREQLIGQRDLSPLDRSIDVRISRLRRKLESDPQNPKIIKTVYGAGYMFSAAVTWS